jgi:hypothetical protein
MYVIMYLTRFQLVMLINEDTNVLLKCKLYYTGPIINYFPLYFDKHVAHICRPEEVLYLYCAHTARNID